MAGGHKLKKNDRVYWGDNEGNTVFGVIINVYGDIGYCLVRNDDGSQRRVRTHELVLDNDNDGARCEAG